MYSQTKMVHSTTSHHTSPHLASAQFQHSLWTYIIILLNNHPLSWQHQNHAIQHPSHRRRLDACQHDIGAECYVQFQCDSHHSQWEGVCLQLNKCDGCAENKDWVWFLSSDKHLPSSISQRISHLFDCYNLINLRIESMNVSDWKADRDDYKCRIILLCKATTTSPATSLLVLFTLASFLSISVLL